jgi:biotin carboxylase
VAAQAVQLADVESGRICSPITKHLEEADEVRCRKKAPMIERLSSSSACVSKANAKSRLEIMGASGRRVSKTSE